MGDLPERFRLVVGFDPMFTFQQFGRFHGHTQARDATEHAQRLASENVGHVFCVMTVEAAYRAPPPVAHQEHLPWPEAPKPEAADV